MQCYGVVRYGAVTRAASEGIARSADTDPDLGGGESGKGVVVEGGEWG